jgi:transposase
MTTSDQTHKVQNWSEYNEALVDRGRLTVWLGEQAIENWKHDGPTQQGAQWIFTDLAVKTCLQIKVVYGLTLRETEGFVESIVEMMGLEKQVPVPDYTTLSKRQGDLDIEIQSSKGSLVGGEGGSEEDKVHLVIDSTGLKVYGEGEWKQSVYGKQKRRTWRKLHLGVDSDTGEITAVGLTDNTSHDGSQVENLLEQTLDQTDKELSAVGGDGAYDAWDVYDAITDREATPVIPPQRNAKIKKHGNCSGPPLPRDEAIRYIRGHGRKKWKRVSGYHRRSLAETAVYRFKQLMGRFVEARRWENERTEVRLKAKALNKMTRLGMPETSKTAV